MLPGQPVDEESCHPQRVQSGGLHGGATVGEPAADDERSRQRGGSREKARDVVRVVLTVPVERQHALGTAGERLGEARAQRPALAAAACQAEHGGARGRGRVGAVVGGAVVHDEDLEGLSATTFASSIMNAKGR